MCKTLMTDVQQRRDSVNWREGCLRGTCKYVNLFEIAKVATVDMPMERVLKVKMGARSVAEDRVRPQTLSTNILEAMLQDVSQGSNDNADAGFELMSEPYHTIYDRSPPPGLGNGIPKEWERVTGQDGSSLGVQDLRPPLP